MRRLIELFTFICLLALLGAAGRAQAQLPKKLPPGMGAYVMVLWPPGSPVPGDAPGRSIKVPEPEVPKFGGTVVYEKDNRRIVILPLGRAKELRKHEAVAYLQRIWMGEPLEDWNESYAFTGDRLAKETQGDIDLQWGPKAYSYDGSGNITQIGTDPGADHYVYDVAGRLVQATVKGKTQNYQYDAFGNLLVMQVAGANPVTVDVDPGTNRIRGVGYDAAGNVSSGDDGRRAYKYDSLNMLTRVESMPGYERRMVYDANDERLGMIVVGDSLSRWTIRDLDGRVLREYKADSLRYWYWELDYFYGEGSLVGGETQEWGYTQTYRYGGRRHYHLDHLGSVRMVTDNTGTRARSLSEHDYFPFGTTLTRTYQEQLNWADPHIDSMRYAGHWRDFLGLLNVDNTEYLDYMHARYYDPNLGRFLSVDPVVQFERAMHSPQLWNRYTYVRNNPSRFRDPTGKYTCSGYGSECEGFLRGLMILAAAAGEATRARVVGATQLANLVTFFGKPNVDNGVHVEFSSFDKGGAAKTTLNTDNDIVTVRINRSNYDRYNYFESARLAAHEGDHGLTLRQNPTMADTRKIPELRWLELHAYRTEAYINNALRVDDELFHLWSKETGFDPFQIEEAAARSVDLACQNALCIP